MQVDTGDAGSIPGSGKMPWRRKRQPTPVLLPGKSIDSGALRATVHRVAESDTTKHTWIAVTPEKKGAQKREPD